jgi:hypothetical protein
MNPKHFYLPLLICCLGMLSSANQTSSDCKQEKVSAKVCCKKAVVKESAAEQNKLALQPLNLLLFEL